VIDTATNTVIATITIPNSVNTVALAVSPDGSKIYVTNNNSGNVSVIATGTNTVIATIAVGLNPLGVAVTPDNSKVYVANEGSGTVSAIDTATNAVTAMIPVGVEPVAFGLFIQPPPKFAGTAGRANCYGQSASALTQVFWRVQCALPQPSGSPASGRCKMPSWRFAENSIGFATLV